MLKNILIVLLTVILSTDTMAEKPKTEASIDMKFLRLDICVDPAVCYIRGVATEYFSIKSRNDRFQPIRIDLSSSLRINHIMHNDDTLEFSHHDNTLYISPTSAWSETDSVTISYEGVPPVTGLGSTCFRQHDGIPIFWTLSEPYGARDWFPCKQDISDKIDSTFLIINCPKRYRAAANGKLFRERVIGDKRITEWRHKYPCAYYLLAVSVTEYKVYSDWLVVNGDSIEIVNYVYPERYEQCKRKTWRLCNTFKMMCDSFGLYPFAKEKYGHAQFGWTGGMEHQTMSFMASFDLDLMIHELAHQWFGDMITCKSWCDVFLNEGFATYCEELATEKGFASSQDPVQWRKATILKACTAKHSQLRIADTSDIHKLFDTKVVYCKGAMVLHMLRKELGDALFFQSMKAYANDRRLRFNNASAQDFFKIVNTVSGRNLDWFFQQWFFGAGYPTYDIQWQQLSDGLVNIRIHQKTTDSTTSFFRSKVPIMIYGDGGERTLYRLNNYYNDQYFTISPNFVVKYVIFDPNGDVLSRESSTKEAELVKNYNITVKEESKNGKIKVIIPEDDSFEWYTIRDIESKMSYRGHIPNSGHFEIHTNNIPEGKYILQLDGKDYYSSKITIYHPKKRDSDPVTDKKIPRKGE